VPFVGADLAARGLGQLLRVPGTRNTKYDPAPLVELLHFDPATRYALAELKALLPPVEPPAPHPAPRPAAPIARQRGESLIATFNAAHNVRDLWTSYGGTIRGDTGACNCGVAHDNTTQTSFTSEGQIVFYTTRCGWAPSRTDRNGRPIADAFDLYAIVEHNGDKKAAVAALRSQEPRRAPNYPTHPVEAGERRHSAPGAAEARRLEAERKREQRRRATVATMDAVHERLQTDAELRRCPSYGAVLRELLNIAGGHIRCRPSVAPNRVFVNLTPAFGSKGRFGGAWPLRLPPEWHRQGQATHQIAAP